MYGIIYKSYNFIPAIPKTAFHHLLGHFPSTKCAAHFVMFVMFAKHLALSLMYQESMKSRSANRGAKVRGFIHLSSCQRHYTPDNCLLMKSVNSLCNGSYIMFTSQSH